jgi:hypothetical protein
MRALKSGRVPTDTDGYGENCDANVKTTKRHMSAISAIPAVISPSAHTHGNGIVVAKMTHDLEAIGSKLKSGNLSAAQTALSTFQQNVQGNPPFGMNSQANMDYQNLMADVQSGDLPAAQKNFDRLQTDLKPEKATTKSGSGGQHHHSSEAGAATAPIKGLTKGSSTSLTSTALAEISAATPAASAMDSDADNNGSLLNLTA